MSDFYSQNSERFLAEYESVSFSAIHKSWRHLIPSTKSLILDVGAGSGRDAAWLAAQGHEVVAVEPAKSLREKAREIHPTSIQWIADTLPSLKEVYKFNLKFDLILLSAVWIHIAPSDRQRSFRKLANLLKPGGKLVITLRHGPSPDKRVMHPCSSGELRQLANKSMLEILLDTESKDQLGRLEIFWTTVVFALPDDGTGALPLLRHIIINDAKSSSYKLALLRTILRIADGCQGMVLEQDDDIVTLPFGLVALYWIKMFKKLVLDDEYPQQPLGSGNLGFAKPPFYALKRISPYDLRIGAKFGGINAKNVLMAMRDARDTIKKMPAFYTTYPNKQTPVFRCEKKQVRVTNTVKLDVKFFSKFGFFKVPRFLWDAMTRYSCWIEPAIIKEWCDLMASYDSKGAYKRTLDEYYDGLKWLDEVRDTTEVRGIIDELKSEGKSIHCVWTGDKLENNYDVDHCFPFSYWPNNDLWNLLPATPRANSAKSFKLPSAELLENSKEYIFDWWYKAYKTNLYFERFIIEASAALPSVRDLTVEDHFERVFSGMQNHRIRLKIDQQLQEWNGLRN